MESHSFCLSGNMFLVTINTRRFKSIFKLNDFKAKRFSRKYLVIFKIGNFFFYLFTEKHLYVEEILRFMFFIRTILKMGVYFYLSSSCLNNTNYVKYAN